METDALLELLKEFIKESKEAAIANVKEHKDINRCLTAMKVQIGAVENLCQNSADVRRACFKKQDDFEDRLRKVELLKPLNDLPKKFEDLAIKVYGIVGAMTLIMLLAGWMLRNSILAGVN